MSEFSDNKEVLLEFLAESRENLGVVESSLLELESDPSARAVLDGIFRGVHSVKGSCGFLGFAQLEGVMHAGEELLARARAGQVALDHDAIEVLLRLVDMGRRMLQVIESTGAETPTEVAPLLAAIARVGAGRATSLDVEPSASREADAVGDGRIAGADGKIRVDVTLLDRLMNLVGELVLARNQTMQHAATTVSQGNTLAATAQRLNLVTTELQEAVMKTRMQPIGNLLNRFPRTVRDVAAATGKLVRLEVEGRETELDKTILEGLQDPLTHLIRNAVDHGIEPPEVRHQRAKPREGRVTVRAYHEGGMVNVVVSDDGGGIDHESVAKRAIAMNLASLDQVRRMSAREVLQLVFHPGLSTKDHVTNLSGRGVGMDVVRTNIETIGGSVDLQSERERGTTIKIKIPLTLAIIPALIVACGEQRYAIPQASLLEVVHLEPEQAARDIESVHGVPVFRLRGRLLPLVDLTAELRLGARSDASHGVSIVVLQADERRFGLVVDEIRDTEEIVVKPLWKRLKPLACYAGATVMGDGRVALILDVLGLGQRVGIVTESREHAAPAQDAAREAGGDRSQLLLCRAGTDGRQAIPLSKVARLEELAVARIERAGPTEVAQYRSTILPLVRVTSVLEERRRRPRGPDPAPTDKVQVVVCSQGGRSVGLVVDEILDVVDVRVALERPASRRGVLGAFVVHERVTELLDVDGIIAASDHAQGLLDLTEEAP